MAVISANDTFERACGRPCTGQDLLRKRISILFSIPVDHSVHIWLPLGRVVRFCVSQVYSISRKVRQEIFFGNQVLILRDDIVELVQPLVCLTRHAGLLPPSEHVRAFANSEPRALLVRRVKRIITHRQRLMRILLVVHLIRQQARPLLPKLALLTRHSLRIEVGHLPPLIDEQG